VPTYFVADFLTMASESERNFQMVNFAVLTVSDTRTPAEDLSGDLLVRRITDAGHTLAARTVVRDEIVAIEAVLRQWIDDAIVDVVISTGGTGITGRDVTPEAFHRVLEKEIPGFGELFRMQSYAKVGLAAIQSRALGGVAGNTYLFALPGSPTAVADAWDMILGPQFDRTQTCSFVALIPRLLE
jgi:molybdenum cofactor biosynthesis protein B